MFRSVQIRIIIIFTVITMILVAGISIYYMVNLQDIVAIAQNETSQNVVELALNIQQTGKVLLIYSVASIIIISLVIGMFVLKRVNNPIRNLIKNAKRIASGEETR